MPHRSRDILLDISRTPIEELDETSDERFDRAAFARRALELVQPPRRAIALAVAELAQRPQPYVLDILLGARALAGEGTEGA